MNTWRLNEILRPLERLIIGDGLKHGYIFSHPRLGSYFYDKLMDLDRKDMDLRFIDYGKETLKKLNEEVLQPSEPKLPMI